ncbi:hypothetical protein DV704_08650 [Meiothermus sp. QL-1]|uniref:hypothetical protein n=1 Tax=Meiothermus sp. QL-1 TaxID=2058095 RepID=UPI000E0BBE23|nr:hypothetical protein [Meiothermus sp. QL-1]RDI95132.1 hypothetical protein DV704_08650 [Meiothermus sp. QL-1]
MRWFGWLGFLLLAGTVWGQAERYVDALHGFALTLPQGYLARVESYGVLAGDLEAFLLVRGLPLKAPREAVTPFLEEARRLSAGQARHHFKAFPGGLLLLSQGLGYPWPLAGRLTTIPLPAYQDPFLLGLRYEAAHLLLPGPKSLLSVSAYLPADAPAQARREALAVLRSLEFLPPGARVAYGVQAVRDPVLGMEAFYAPVPQGWRFQGGLVPASAHLRHLAFRLQGEGVSLRRDLLYTQAQGVQGPFGGGSQTSLLWNGQGSQLSGFLCPATGKEVVEFLLGLWGQETGRVWQAGRVGPARTPQSRVARRFQELQEAYEASTLTGLPFTPQVQRVRLELEAASGGLVRKAYVAGNLVFFNQPSTFASGAYCSLGLEVVLEEGTREALAKAQPLLFGFRVGLRAHPEWGALEAQRGQQAGQTTTRMLLEKLRQDQEFNTWMRRSWANLLSDQTYVRDPSTGEVFRAYKASFDTGTFWRDPVFGGVVGAVERGGQLEEMLRQGGWRQLEESLSGLPGTWQR